MPETLIPLSQSKGIRLVCTCGAEVTVPAGAANVPHSCFNCNTPFPFMPVKELASMLEWVKSSAGNGKLSVELVLIGPESK